MDLNKCQISNGKYVETVEFLFRHEIEKCLFQLF